MPLKRAGAQQRGIVSVRGVEHSRRATEQQRGHESAAEEDAADNVNFAAMKLFLVYMLASLLVLPWRRQRQFAALATTGTLVLRSSAKLAWVT